MNRFFVGILLFLLLGYQASAQTGETTYYVVEDLQSEWLAIDQENRYVPFVAERKNRPSAIGVRLDLERYQGNQVQCCVPAGTSILLNKQILASASEARCFTYDIDSLQQAYQSNHILLTVYQPSRQLEEVTLRIVNDGATPLSADDDVLHRVVSAREDFFVLGLVIILMMYALLINQYPKTFKNIYSLSRIVVLRVREEDMRVRLASEPHLLFLIQHCLLVAFLLTLFVAQPQVPFMPFLLESLGSYLLLWLVISALILLIVLIKYFIIVMFGALFKLRHLIHLHMFDFMRLSLMFWGGAFLLAVCVYYNVSISTHLYGKILTYLFVGFALVRVVILYLRLFRNASFKNMYLFSYICTAEIIPLCVGLELLSVW